MAFSAAGVQTGTDNDLTGLLDITDVTSETVGGITTYTIPAATTLTIEGTVNHNTELERISFLRAINGANDAVAIHITSGTYNFGLEKVPNSGIFTDGVGWVFNGGTIWFNGSFSAGNNNGAHIVIGNATGSTDEGVLNMNGGRIGGRFTLTMNDAGTLNNTTNAKFLVDDSAQTAGQEYLFRFYNSTINAQDLSYEGGTISMGTGSSGRNISLNRNNAGIAYWNQTESGISTIPTDDSSYVTVSNVSLLGNTVDYASRAVNNTTGFCGTRLQNIQQGTALEINGGEVGAVTTVNGGYVAITRTIATNIVDLANGDNQQGIIWVRDTNRWDDLANPNVSFDDDVEFTYRFGFNGTIQSFIATGGYSAGQLANNSGDNEIVLASWNRLNDGANINRATAHAGDWAYNRRGNSAVYGEDTFTFNVWSYENEFVELTNQNLAGVGDFEISLNTVPDTNVTLSRAAATAVNNLVGTNLAYTSTSITFNEGITLDQLYDLVKLRKEIVTGDIEIPTANSLIISSDGNGIDFGALTLTFGADVTLSAGTNHTSVSHDLVLDLVNFNLSNLTVTAPSFSDLPTTLPAGSALVGTFTYTGATDFNLTVEEGADVSGLILVNNGTGAFNISGAVVGDFDVAPSGTGTFAFPFNITINSDVEADITFRRGNGTFIHVLDATTTTLNSVTHGLTALDEVRIVASAAGFRGNPVTITMTGRDQTVDLTTFDLSALGYDSTIDIGGGRVFTRTVYEGRQSLIATQNSGQFNYIDGSDNTTADGVKWFGDLYGARNAAGNNNLMNEVILSHVNLILNSDAGEIFTLNPSNNVTVVNIPIVQARHGTGVASRLEFNADVSVAKLIETNYELTDGFTPTGTEAPGSGVVDVPQSITGLAGTINIASDRVVQQVNANTDAEAEGLDGRLLEVQNNLATTVAASEA